MTKFKLLLRRLSAIFYDAVLVFGVSAAGFTVIYVPLAMYLDNTEIGRHPLFQVYVIILAIGFHLWFWTHGGQTLGMRTWRMKVVRNDGQKLRFSDALIRYAAAILSALPFGLGFLWVLVDDKARAWHDILSKTHLQIIEKSS